MEAERSSFGKWLGSLSVQYWCQWYEQTRSGVVVVSVVLLVVHVQETIPHLDYSVGKPGHYFGW